MRVDDIYNAPPIVYRNRTIACLDKRCNDVKKIEKYTIKKINLKTQGRYRERNQSNSSK